MASGNIRLYVTTALAASQLVALSREQAHYLFSVMRLRVGDQVRLFNGQDGEWRADVAEAGKRAGLLRVVSQSGPQLNPPDLWLLFAPIKKARTDFIVEKAAEMGVSAIFPVQTDFTNSERVRRDRLQAHAVEAAEQCGGTYVPQVADLQKLEKTLQDWPSDRQLIFADEAAAGQRLGLTASDYTKHAILIGPEGGFSSAERARLLSLDHAMRISLGPRILRADTAAVAALALWQSALGDWA